MSNSKHQEYSKRYVMSGEPVIVKKENNKYKQMASDSFVLESTQDFGGHGGGVMWQYIHEPLDMFPGCVMSEEVRHITILGGKPSNYLKLLGEVEITLGSSKDAVSVFKFDTAVSVYIKKGMYYNINVTKIDNSDYPIHFNEFVFGDLPPAADEPLDTEDFSKYIVFGDALHAKNQPHHEVVYPVIYTGSSLFNAKEPVRRTWMPVSNPHVLAEKAHYHEFLEYIVFYGSDPENISDLGGTVEFTIGENKDDLTVFRITQSTQFFVKPGLWHSPMVFTEIKDPDKPIIFCEVSYAGAFGQDYAKSIFIDGIPPMPQPAPKK